MLVFAASLGACAADDGTEAMTGETGETSADDSGADGSPAMTADGPIPSEPDALLSWLQGGGYVEWDAESAVHAGAGPHFGAVRTFLSEELVASLSAGAAQHPAGSATVKELYGGGDTLRGWTVSIKLEADSAGGEGWYWYEWYDDAVLADGAGLGACTGCHAAGDDYVLIPFPLQ